MKCAFRLRVSRTAAGRRLALRRAGSAVTGNTEKTDQNASDAATRTSGIACRPCLRITQAARGQKAPPVDTPHGARRTDEDLAALCKATEHAIEFFGEGYFRAASEALFDPEGGPVYI